MPLPAALVAEVAPRPKSRAALESEVQRLGEVVERLVNRAEVLRRYLRGADLVSDDAKQFRQDLIALIDGNMR